MTRIIPVSLLALVAALPLPGCRAGNFENENDILRAKVFDLEDEVAALRLRDSELETRLAAAERVPGEIDAEVRANTPQVAALGISRLSHVRRDDGGEGAPTLVLYVEPVDGRGRFLQLAGTLAVNVAVLPAGGPARTIGSATLGPAELRDAYRSAFTGTHYTIEIPVEPAGDADTCEVRAVYTDGWTGQERAVTSSVSFK